MDPGHGEETDTHFYEKKNALILIFDRISLRIEKIISDESTTTRTCHRKLKSNIFSLNIWCVFFILILEKEQAK